MCKPEFPRAGGCLCAPSKTSTLAARWVRATPPFAMITATFIRRWGAVIQNPLERTALPSRLRSVMIGRLADDDQVRPSRSRRIRRAAR